MSKKAVRAVSDTFNRLSAVGKLKAEIELLTRCSNDTVYRLRYDTMRYDYISPSVTQLLGYTVAELQRINLRSLILETRIISDGMRAVESYASLEENRKRGEVRKWQADYLMKTKNGKRIWVSDISYPWFDKYGTIIGSVGCLRDITERMVAEQKIREDLLHQAGGDPLTGLAGRHAFWQRLEEEAARIHRTNGDMALLLLDIDHFHKVNEAYGQEMGNTVLAGVAKIIRKCVREIDLIARLGGEEFAIILPESTCEGGLKAAERIRDSVVRHTFFASARKPVGVTVSIGVASTRLGQTANATQIYKLADMRLYVAKHTGAGQISAEELAGAAH